jgi:hypothetical protein
MKTGTVKMETNESATQSVLECGGKRSATPLWVGVNLAGSEKLRRRCGGLNRSKRRSRS